MKRVHITESKLREYVNEAIEQATEELKEKAQECLNFIVNSIESIMGNYVDLSHAEWSNVWQNEMPGMMCTYAMKLMWNKEDEIEPIPQETEQVLQKIAQNIQNNYGIRVKYIGLNRTHTRVEIGIIVNPYVWRYTKYEKIPNLKTIL